jgi:hypothetical protein
VPAINPEPNPEEGISSSSPSCRVPGAFPLIARSQRKDPVPAINPEPNPEGISSSSPTLPRQRLPWENVPQSDYPERVASIPDIPLIEFDFVTLQQPAELILKRNLAVMFFLRRNVGSNFVNLRLAD